MESRAREELQHLVTQLPEPVIPAALPVVAELAGHADRFLADLPGGPEDEEAPGPRAIAKGDADFGRGRVHSSEELRREFDF